VNMTFKVFTIEWGIILSCCPSFQLTNQQKGGEIKT
jgi:hypothetical protein